MPERFILFKSRKESTPNYSSRLNYARRLVKATDYECAWFPRGQEFPGDFFVFVKDQLVYNFFNE